MKRAFDLVLVLLALPLWLPLVCLLWILVRVTMGAPAFFVQQRPGVGGDTFGILKFRTMSRERDGTGRLLPDAERLTSFGRWLRASSLDELPELVNVLKGDMSLVGPRPLLQEYLRLYNPDQARRHEVCPGITGWAQVNGRNALTWPEKFSLDVWYVDNRTLWLDIRILWRTVMSVARKDGISAEGEATMPKFSGNEE